MSIINSFPGYEFVKLADGKYHNMFRGTDVGYGGYVFAQPNFYGNVVTLDVGNMHGASIDELNKFGKHTQRYRDIRNARMAIKHHDFEAAKNMLDGKLAPYLSDEKNADDLQKALKLILNSTYGIAAATFENPLKDPRDTNNIIALRGALFMRTLQDEVRDRGFTVAHIKTDSIKIPDATPEIINFVIDFGKKYGYEFEHESTYEKMCLVNDAVFIAKYTSPEKCQEMYGYVPSKNAKHPNEWTATGTQFQVPYVFKTLFSHEKIEFSDTCETKSVTTAMYLDMNEDLPEGEHNYVFVGRVGQFTPIKPGCGGGELLRYKDGKYSSVTGAKGYRWLESEAVRAMHKEDCVDKSYYTKLVDAAVDTIRKYVDFDWFASDEPYAGSVPFMNRPIDDDEELPF